MSRRGWGKSKPDSEFASSMKLLLVAFIALVVMLPMVLMVAELDWGKWLGMFVPRL